VHRYDKGTFYPGGPDAAPEAAGVGAGLVLIVFQTVCQGVNRGCEGAPEVRSLVTDDYAKPPPPSKYGAAGTAPV